MARQAPDRPLLLVSLLLVALALPALGSQPHDRPGPAAAPHRPHQNVGHGPPHELIGKDGLPMKLVPAGPFTMGSLDGDADERPAHPVSLPSYYMDIYEITTAHYARFLAATGRARPYHWEDVHPPTDDLRPVIGVYWEEAQAYCRWVGERLPTEAEWEKAARGPDGRPYPWGNHAPTPALANYNWDGTRAWTGYAVLAPVGSYEAGKSPYGIYDLAGNVWEWVADWYVDHYPWVPPAHKPTGTGHSPYKVRRGGSWANAPSSLRAANRDWESPAEQSGLTGFRCVQDVDR